MHKLHKSMGSPDCLIHTYQSCLLAHSTFLLFFSPFFFPGRVQGLPSVSALKFNGSLNIAVGTSTGQVHQNCVLASTLNGGFLGGFCLFIFVWELKLILLLCLESAIFYWYVSTLLFVLISIVYFHFTVEFQLLVRNIKFQFFN